MVEQTIGPFLLYSLGYAALVMLAGCYSVYCGTRLLLGAPHASDSNETEIDLKSKAAQLYVRTRGAGISLTLFGTLMMVAVLVLGRPALVIEGVDPDAKSTRLEIRGGDIKDNLSSLVSSAVSLDLKGDTAQAIGLYDEALEMIATPMNNRAWHLFLEGDFENALGLSQVACAITPENENNRDTLYKIENAIRAEQKGPGIEDD